MVAVDVALRLAREAGLDLVEVAPSSRPPVAKIMDFGKFKYEQAQKAKEARRNQANTVLKEVRFRLKIDEHDYETKRKRAEGFLQAGDKVKAMILFRGREQSRPEMGVKLLQRFAADVAEWGSIEARPTIDGRNMTMVVGPLRSKSDAKAEQNQVRKEQRAEQQERRRAHAEHKAASQGRNADSGPEAKPGDATFEVSSTKTPAQGAAQVATAKSKAAAAAKTAPAGDRNPAADTAAKSAAKPAADAAAKPAKSAAQPKPSSGTASE